MAAKSRRISNNAGSANSFLNAVKEKDTAAKYAASAEVEASSISKKHEKLVKSILQVVQKGFADSNDYNKKLDSKSIDVTLGRIASLLDEFRKDFADNELADIKDEILDEISGISTSTILKSFIASQISKLFDDTATKSDIEELKDWISANTIVDNPTFSKEEDLRNEPSGSDNASVFMNKEVDSLEDEKEGEYQDSTIAKNFNILQNYVGTQVEALNENLKNIPGQAGILSKIGLAVALPFKAISGALSKMTKGIANVISKTASVAASIAKAPFKMIGSGIAKLTKGIAGIGSKIVGLGSKIGGAIASPFRAIGGFVSKLNPFKRSPKEDKKQKLKDKMMDFMAKILEKIWNVIEPFVDKVAFFMGLVSKFVIVPIALIALKVLLIVGAITALAVGLVLVAMWAKKKIMQFWNYIVSGELLNDIIAGLVNAWEWLKDFGKWLWDITIKALKYIFVDMWVDLGKWIWQKLCDFGNWLYDNYIYKYIVYPFKKYVWEPLQKLWKEKVWPMIEPFITSLTELKDKIVKAFSAWDSNKSIWENMKNIGGIIKDSIAEWWQNSPFKKLWDDTIWPTVKPFIDSLTELKDKIVKAFSAWDTEKSIWENLKNIGGIIRNSIVEWWNDDKNPIRALYNKYVQPIIDKIKDFGKTITNGIHEWWQKSTLKKWIDDISTKMRNMLEKIGNAIWKLPMIGYMRPFGFLLGKPLFLSEDEEKEQDNIRAREEQIQKQKEELESKIKDIGKEEKSVDKEIAQIEKYIATKDYKGGDGTAWTGRTKDEMERDLVRLRQQKMSLKQQASDLAAQQVQQAAKPIQQIEAMQKEGNAELQKTGQEMSSEIAKKEQQQKKFDIEQSDKSDDIREELRAFRQDYNKNAKDPAAVPVYVPLHEQVNPALMYAN